MILYHASPFVIERPDVYHSREHLDFGKGFYLTAIREQAEKYAMRFTVGGRRLILMNICWMMICLNTKQKYLKDMMKRGWNM